MANAMLVRSGLLLVMGAFIASAIIQGPRAGAASTAAVPFMRPTSGELVTGRGYSGEHAGHDIRDEAVRPLLLPGMPGNRSVDWDPPCTAISGSTDTAGNVVDHGGYRRDGNCLDFEGAPVRAASFGLATFAGVHSYTNPDHNVTTQPHVVRIYHGTLAESVTLGNGTVLPIGRKLWTEYWHMGNKVRLAHDADGDGTNRDQLAAGAAQRTYITINPQSCVRLGQQIGAQGYSGNTTGTHLHYEILEGGENAHPSANDGTNIDPSDWYDVSRRVRINPPPDCPMLTVQITGSGYVTSTDGDIACGANQPGFCQTNYPRGRNVTLTAHPSGSGTSFSGWSGDAGACSASPSPLTCTVPLDATRAVTATFGTPDPCPQPAPSSQPSSSASSCPAPVTPTVTVTPDGLTLTVSKQGSGIGTVTSSPTGIGCGLDCSEAYASGTVVTLTATAGAGSRFDGWGGSCSGTGAYCDVTVDASKLVTAIFTNTSSGSGLATPIPVRPRNEVISTTNPAYTWQPVAGNSGYEIQVRTSSGSHLFYDSASASNYCGGGSCSFTSRHGLGTGDYQWRVRGYIYTRGEPLKYSDWSDFAPFSINVGSQLKVARAGNGAGNVVGPRIACPPDCDDWYPSGTWVTLLAYPDPDTTFGGWTGCDEVEGTRCRVIVFDARDGHTATATFIAPP